MYSRSVGRLVEQVVEVAGLASLGEFGQRLGSAPPLRCLAE
jgi:hypothetical protein